MNHRLPARLLEAFPRRRLAAAFYCVLGLAPVACHGGGPPRPSQAPPGEIPIAVVVPEASFDFGFAVGKHTTTLSIPSFALSRTPITVGEYKQCVAAGACSVPKLGAALCGGPRVPVVEGKTYDASPSADGLPVTCVAPRQATEYCGWVGGTLPTIEQWVYAARGPTVQEFAWGNTAPDCSKNQRAKPVRGQHTGCCQGRSCDPDTYFAVAQHPDVASPQGLLDVLLTPTELIRGHQGSLVPACSAEGGACVVRGLVPGSIDFAASVSDDVGQDAYLDPGVVAGFRCAFEVKS